MVTNKTKIYFFVTLILCACAEWIGSWIDSHSGNVFTREKATSQLTRDEHGFGFGYKSCGFAVF